MLEANGGSADGGILILVSGGFETIGPFIHDVTGDLVRKGVVVHTILNTNEADDEMIQLAADTGGICLYAANDPEWSEPANLLSVFRTLITGDDSAAPGTIPIEVGNTMFRSVVHEHY